MRLLRKASALLFVLTVVIGISVAFCMPATKADAAIASPPVSPVVPVHFAPLADVIPSWCFPGMPCSFRGIAGGVIDDVTKAISDKLAEGVTSILSGFYNQIDSASNVRNAIRSSGPTATNGSASSVAGFIDAYERQMGIALVILVPLVIGATIQYLLAGQPGQIVRLYVVMVPLAIAGGFAAIFFVDSLMIFMDRITILISPNFHNDLKDVIATLSESALLLAPVGFILFLIGGIGLILGTLALLIELVAREVMIATALLFIPLAFAGVVWPVTSPWLKRSLRIILSLGFVKFVMIALLSVGILVLNGQLHSHPASSIDRAQIPVGHVTSAIANQWCQNESIAPLDGNTNSGQEWCMKQKGTSFKGMVLPSDPAIPAGPKIIDDVLAACRPELGGITAAKEKTMTPAEVNTILSQYYMCWDQQTDLYSSIPSISKLIASSGVLTQQIGFDSVTNIISGMAIFLLAALSPAIAFKIFDIFDAGIEQVRYARRGSSISPARIPEKVVATTSIVDLVTKGKGTSFIND